MDGMPKPTKQHLKLKRFVGQWEGKEKLSPSPWGPGGEATGRYTGRLDLEGFFVIQDYVEEKDYGDSTYTFRLENSFDGGKTYNLMMEGTYQRT